MIRLSFLASARHLGRHPWLVFMCVLGIAIGVAVVLGIHIAGRSARMSFQRSSEAIVGRATHAIVGGSAGVPDHLYRTLRVDLGVEDAAPRLEADVSGSDGRSLRLLGIDVLAEAPFRTYLVPGTETTPSAVELLGTAGAAWIHTDTADALEVGVGDRLVVHHGPRTIPLKIVAVLQTRDSLGREGLTDAVVVDIATAQEGLGRMGVVDRIDLRLGDDPDVLTVIRQKLPNGVALTEAQAAARHLQQMTAAFDLNIRALSMLAVVVGMFLIYNTMTFLVVQRRGLWGMLRAKGVTRRQVFALVLGEAAILGLVGSLFGIVLGIALSRSLLELVTRTISDLYYVVSGREVQIDPKVFALGLGVGLITALVAAAVPAWEATRVAPASALRRSDLERSVSALVLRLAGLALGCGGMAIALLLYPSQSLGWGYAGLFLVVFAFALLVPLATRLFAAMVRPGLARLLGVLGRLAAGGVSRHLSRTGVAIGALVVAVATMLAVGIMIESFRASVVRWLDRTLQADVYVSLPSPVARRASDATLPPQLVDRIADLAEVDHVTTNRTVDVLGETGSLRLIALDIQRRHLEAFEFREGDPERAWSDFARNDSVLVSEPFAYRHRLGKGDAIGLRTRAGLREFRIVGVVLDYSSEQGTVTMHRETYGRHFLDPGVTAVGVFGKEGVTSVQLEQALRRSLADTPGLKIRRLGVLRRATLDVFDRTFAVTSVLRSLTAIVAFIGVLSALMALQFERMREFAILRARGLTPAQCWSLVTMQGALMGFFAGLFALPLGTALAVVLTAVINRRSFGWTLSVELTAGLLVEAVALAVVAAVLASLWPARRAARLPLARALREE